MRINLEAIAPPEPGAVAVQAFEGVLDLSGLSRFGEKPFPDPVRVRGEVRQQHGEWTVRYTAAAHLRQSCSRCLGPAEREVEFAWSHPVSTEARDDLPDGVIPAPGGLLDVQELAGADLSLSLEGVPLCREDCLGLCPACGGNLGERDCGCGQEKPTDPRFAALKALIEQED